MEARPSGLSRLRSSLNTFLDALEMGLSPTPHRFNSEASYLVQNLETMTFQTLGDYFPSILQDVLIKLDECKAEVCSNLENAKKSHPQPNLCMSKIYEKIWEEKMDLMKMKEEYKDMIVMQGMLNTTQQVVKEKNEEIARLRRASVIQLWEREKAKALQEALLRENVLKEAMEKKETNWAETKEKLIKKTKDYEDLMKKIRLKEEIQATSRVHFGSEEPGHEAEKLKQKQQLTEKDLVRVKDEQKHTLSFLAGLKEDFMMLTPFSQVRTHLKPVTSSKYWSVIGELQRLYSNSDQESLLCKFYKLTKKKLQRNPCHLKTLTGLLDVALAKRHYPSLSEDEIILQNNLFDKYDRNHDGYLDISEMVAALADVVEGREITFNLTKEFLAEVDQDKDSRLSFYEYLGVCDLIKRNAGQCQLLNEHVRWRYKGMKTNGMPCTVQ